MLALSVDLLQIPTDMFIIRCFAAALYQSGSGSIYGSQRPPRGRLHSQMFTRWHYYQRDPYVFLFPNNLPRPQENKKHKRVSDNAALWRAGGLFVSTPPTIHPKKKKIHTLVCNAHSFPGRRRVSANENNVKLIINQWGECFKATAENPRPRPYRRLFVQTPSSQRRKMTNFGRPAKQRSRDMVGLMLVVHGKNWLNILTLQAAELIEFGLRWPLVFLPEASRALADASKFLPLIVFKNMSVVLTESLNRPSPSGFIKRQKKSGGTALNALLSLSQPEKVKQPVYLSKTKPSPCSGVGKKDK